VYRYKGKVGTLTAEQIATALSELQRLTRSNDRLRLFASMVFETDLNDPTNGRFSEKITAFNAYIEAELLFFILEWQALSDEQSNNLLTHPSLQTWRHYLAFKRQFSVHRLTEAEEQLFIERNTTGRLAWERFYDQLVASITVSYHGIEHRIEALLAQQYQPDRDARQEIYEAIATGLQRYSFQLTYVMNVLLADKEVEDRKRGYERWISQRNLQNKVSDETVEALVSAVTATNDLVARHYKLKRKLLGLREMAIYDRYAPMVIDENAPFYTWDEARLIILDAFKALSPQIGDLAKRFFDEHWIHAPARSGKIGTAFCIGNPAVHPYVLVNFTGQFDDILVLAHELGHGIHFCLAAEANSPYGREFPAVMVETASIFMETLILVRLIEKEPDPKRRLALLMPHVENTLSGVHMQIAYHRFEEMLHNVRHTEGELTPERINQLWLKVHHDLYGDSLTIDERFGMRWGMVWHLFHVPGYVYGYAFSKLLVLSLFNLYQKRGADFVTQFITLLSAGDSDYPHVLFEKISIDISNAEFWSEGLAVIRDLIGQEECLADEVYP
jgi:oligoendopeptidase F